MNWKWSTKEDSFGCLKKYKDIISSKFSTQALDNVLSVLDELCSFMIYFHKHSKKGFKHIANSWMHIDNSTIIAS